MINPILGAWDEKGKMCTKDDDDDDVDFEDGDAKRSSMIPGL